MFSPVHEITSSESYQGIGKLEYNLMSAALTNYLIQLMDPARVDLGSLVSVSCVHNLTL